MTNAEVTLYRCYWPLAYAHLQSCNVQDFVSEACGLLMTLHVSGDAAARLARLLPAGAVLGVDHAEPLYTLRLQEAGDASGRRAAYVLRHLN